MVDSYMIGCGEGMVSLRGYMTGSSKGNKKRHALKENRAAGMMVDVHSKI